MARARCISSEYKKLKSVPKNSPVSSLTSARRSAIRVCLAGDPNSALSALAAAGGSAAYSDTSAPSAACLLSSLAACCSMRWLMIL